MRHIRMWCLLDETAVFDTHISHLWSCLYQVHQESIPMGETHFLYKKLTSSICTQLRKIPSPIFSLASRWSIHVKSYAKHWHIDMVQPYAYHQDLACPLKNPQVHTTCIGMHSSPDVPQISDLLLVIYLVHQLLMYSDMSCSSVESKQWVLWSMGPSWWNLCKQKPAGWEEWKHWSFRDRATYRMGSHANSDNCNKLLRRCILSGQWSFFL